MARIEKPPYEAMPEISFIFKEWLKKLVNSVNSIAGITSGTSTASTSGTSVDFTGFPAGTKRITVMLVGVATSSTSPLLLLLGDSGGVEVTGYSAGIGGGNTYNSNRSTTGFLLVITKVAGGVYSGQIILSLENASSNTWVLQGMVSRDDVSPAPYFLTGSKSTSAVLDRIRITTVGGTDTFAGGEINIMYE